MQAIRNRAYEPDDFCSWVADLSLSSVSNSRRLATDMVKNILYSIGVQDPHSFIDSWGEPPSFYSIAYELPRLISLESQRPGIAKFVVQELGMSVFPIQVQADETERLFKKYEGYQKGLSPWEDEEHALEKYGLDPKKLMSAWKAGYPRLFFAIQANMKVIDELEEQRTGIASVLHREFGINFFVRYPNELLSRQYEERDRTDLPYGIILYPRNDHNGAFFNWISDREFQQLNKDLAGKFAIRVLEARSKYDIAKALVRLHRRYGAAHRISFAIIGGHGTKDSIRFGDSSEKRYMLYVEDLFGRGARKTSKFFEQNATIILQSCSTGKEGGIGQKLSEVLGARVIAPDIPTNIESLRATINNGNILFQVKYGEPGVARTYHAGAPESKHDT